jgi:hypothetical protein
MQVKGGTSKFTPTLMSRRDYDRKYKLIAPSAKTREELMPVEDVYKKHNYPVVSDITVRPTSGWKGVQPEKVTFTGRGRRPKSESLEDDILSEDEGANLSSAEEAIRGIGQPEGASPERQEFERLRADIKEKIKPADKEVATASQTGQLSGTTATGGSLKPLTEREDITMHSHAGAQRPHAIGEEHDSDIAVVAHEDAMRAEHERKYGKSLTPWKEKLGIGYREDEYGEEGTYTHPNVGSVKATKGFTSTTVQYPSVGGSPAFKKKYARPEEAETDIKRFFQSILQKSVILSRIEHMLIKYQKPIYPIKKK